MAQPTAIITGGNRGIGRSITDAFVEAGYKVVVGARTDTGLVDAFGENAMFQVSDVRQLSAHERLVETALSWTGRLDVYVNNAGFSAWRPIQDIDEAFLSDLLNTNLKGAFWGCRAAVDALAASRGSIINMSSLASKRGTAKNSAYCASKFAMNGLTQSLAKELGPLGIRVNGVCPVLVRTEGLVEALRSVDSPAAGDPDAFLEQFAKTQSALGRLPSGREVADYCVYLASAQASAITGQNVNIDCGVLPQ